MQDLKKLASLFDDADKEKRLAAAVVVGALALKDAACTDGLVRLLDGPPDEQRAGLLSLASTSPKKAQKKALDLVTAGTPSVREAAAQLLKAIGPDVVDDIKARRAAAGESEKRDLDRVLAEMGGTDAFRALLDGLAAADEQTARAAALSVHKQIVGAPKKTRASFANTTMKVLEKTPKGAARTPQHEAALLKILGWCEDDDSVDTLVAFARDEKKPGAVRQEAIIALRFPLAEGKAKKIVIDVLLDAALGADALVARAALGTVTGARLEEAHLGKLLPLAVHRDPERGNLAINKIREHGGAKAAAVLVDVSLTADRERAQTARDALTTIPEGRDAAVAGLFKAKDADRARALAELLLPGAKDLGKGVAKKLIAELVVRVSDTGRGYEPFLILARALDAEGTADALRDLAAKLKKSKKTEERAAHVLILLSNTDGATDDDRLRLAVSALQKSRLDVRPDSRARDEAIKLFADIAGKVDMKILRKQKSVTDEQLFYLGFHFTEEGEPIGKDLLEEVIARGPRTKLAKAAKNKLQLES